MLPGAVLASLYDAQVSQARSQRMAVLEISDVADDTLRAPY
jgi:hypothetical protein